MKNHNKKLKKLEYLFLDFRLSFSSFHFYFFLGLTRLARVLRLAKVRPLLNCKGLHYKSIKEV